MFGRSRHQPFDITEHPDVIKALNALVDESYQRGFSDALAIAKDLYEEELARIGSGPQPPSAAAYRDGIADVIERLEA